MQAFIRGRNIPSFETGKHINKYTLIEQNQLRVKLSKLSKPDTIIATQYKKAVVKTAYTIKLMNNKPLREDQHIHS